MENEKKTNGLEVFFEKNFAGAGAKLRSIGTKKLVIILACITAVLLAVGFYFLLVPFNVESGLFRGFIIVLLLIWCLPLLSVKLGEITDKWKKWLLLLPVALLALVLAVCLIAGIASAPLFRATDYRNLITVTDNESFTDSVEDYSTMQIPVVDKHLAEKLGEKKLGEDNYGSQYHVGDYYMICHNGNLYWIAPIEYNDLFKWINRPTSPGYLLINANDSDDVQLIREELLYVESAYLWDDLARANYFGNLTAWRAGNVHLELTDDGKPMFVESVYVNRLSFVEGCDVVGIIVTNPTDGTSEYFPVEQAPTWINHVQSEDVIVEQLNYWGEYVGGFWNSIFAQKDVLNVSTGFNYVYSNGNMYLQTGMTSIGSDESIVGVMMVDMRTKEAKFSRIGGATEYAAAQSAIGYEQAMRFTASDPIMINLDGIPTYFMMLKDEEGLVKRYAYVNVASYTIVASAPTRSAALTQYKSMIQLDSTEESTELTVEDIRQVTVGGDTYYYIKFADTEGVFVAPLAVNPALPFIKPADTLIVVYEPENDGTHTVTSLELKGE